MFLWQVLKISFTYDLNNLALHHPRFLLFYPCKILTLQISGFESKRGRACTEHPCHTLHKALFILSLTSSNKRDVKSIEMSTHEKENQQLLAHRLGINPVFVVIRSFEIGEVCQDLAIFIALFLGFLLKHGRYKVGKAQQLGNDGISTANEL